MARSIEFHIRFMAVVIYLIVALGVAGMMMYLNSLRENVSSQRLEIENQYTLLAATNNLMLAVNNAQSLASLYISSRNRSHLDNYTHSIDYIESLIDTLVMFRPNEEETLHRIVDLMRVQSRDIKRLNVQFAERNPIGLIHERLKEVEPHIVRIDSVYTQSVRRDTVITETSSRRGFLKRLGEVFSPGKDSVTVVVSEWSDTVRTVRVDTLAIMYEVGDLARMALEAYEKNIKEIEKRVGVLMTSNQEIATEVTAMLLEFHGQTLRTTLSLIDASGEAIQQNYLQSTRGGALALVLILIFIILIITDINKGRRRRRALEAANERTRQLMESRHKLLLSVSHDIKTPLSSVLAYLSRMKSDPDVRSMQSSSEHVLAMLENLLEFSSLEQGTLQTSLSNFNSKELFTDIYSMFLPLAQQKGLALSFEAEEVRIESDRVKLKQIVINLVSNAIKYTPSGTVSFTAKYRPQALSMEVIDTGVGIPAERFPQLFLPFARVEEHVGVAEGTGLGMFVVKGLTELLGGSIAVQSKVDEGTVVTVTIPVERSVKEIPKGVKRIKVYDDDPVVVKLISDMLLRLGHKVVDSNYDLILTDMEMGDISGLDILHQVAGAVPVVLFTGRADFSVQKAESLGFDGFLAKPVTQEALREVVGEGDLLTDFLADNRDEILALFYSATQENCSILKNALADNNFRQAQAVCHKMLPMFAQLDYPTGALRNMDAHRDGEYEGWQKDVEQILAIEI